MTLNRPGLVAALTASIVVSLLMTGGPALAQVEPPANEPTSRSDRPTADAPAEGLQPAAAGLLTGRLLFSTEANPTVRPVSNGNVTAYRFDTGTSRWVLQAFATTFNGSGDWSLAGLPAGEYRFSFIQGGEAEISRYWYPDSRSFENAGTVELFEAAPLNLPTITMPSRKIYADRFAGLDRFETAAELSLLQFPPDAAVDVVIVSGLDYPDALSAGPLANALGGPMLMVSPTSIPSSVALELDRLNPTTITIVGGTGVVSTAVETQLASYVGGGTNVRRIAGADRYATSRAVITEGFDGIPPETVLVATGRNFPDALAAGSAAGATYGAVLLVDGSASTLTTATRSLLNTLDVPTYLIGGTGSISTGIESSLAGASFPVDRVWGTDRFRTSIAIAIEFFFYSDTAFLVNAYGFADALAAGPFGGAIGAPVYLTEAGCVTDAVWEDIVALLANSVFAVGGTGVLAQKVAVFESCSGDTITIFDETSAPVLGGVSSRR